MTNKDFRLGALVKVSAGNETITGMISGFGHKINSSGNLYEIVLVDLFTEDWVDIDIGDAVICVSSLQINPNLIKEI